ncbi:MAG: ParB/RepB/Spo0J family partition protein [Balneolaceae bacterium]
MSQKKVLGRGLGVFFPDYLDESDEKDASSKTVKTAIPIEKPEPADFVNMVLEVPVDHIRPNPHQPRKEFKEEALEELSDSIKKHGLIQPITVRYLGEKRFELISGERRLRAAKMAGMMEVPSYVREVNDEQLIAFALIENIQREQLNPMEVSMGYKRLMEECDYSQSEVAEKVGKNRSTVANMLRLLQLPDFIQAALKDEKITTGHARALINVESEKDQKTILSKTISQSLSVRQVERLVRSIGEKSEKKTPATDTDKKSTVFYESIERRLRNNFSTKVQVKPKGQGGEIRIEFYSNDDLDRILQLLDETK